MRDEWRRLAAVLTGVDWFCLVASLLLLLPPIAFGTAEPLPSPAAPPTPPAGAVWPITLRPDVSVGNIASIVAALWWVTRWGVKQIEILHDLPEVLRRIDARLTALERTGCGLGEGPRTRGEDA